MKIISYLLNAKWYEAFSAATQLSGDMRFGGHNMGGAGGVLAHGF